MVAAINKKFSRTDVLLTRGPDGTGSGRPVSKRMIAPTTRNAAAPGTPAPTVNADGTPVVPAVATPAVPAAAAPAVAAAAAIAAAVPAAQLSNERIAAIVAGVLQARGAPTAPVAAPAVHNRDSSMFTARDLELLALDAGMRGDDVDRWRAARNGELPAVPAGHSRYKTPAGRRQFKQMRGGRNFGTNVAAEMVGQAAGPDEGVGELWSAWAAYMARASKISGRMDPSLAWKLAQRDGSDAILVRALGESSVIDGGALVPEVVIESYIELLYANTVFLQGQPLRLTLSNGKATLPRLASGATAYWIGENVNVTPSQETFDDVNLSLKKVGLLVPYSNDLANHAMTALQALIRDDMTMNGGIAIDTKLIRGLGTASSPKGVRYEANSGNIFAANATVNVANITQDVASMMQKQLAFNVKGTKWYFMMSPRTLMHLWAARDANNNLVWQNELKSGTFQGRPFGVTTSIPENLGGGSDSELYLVDFAHEVYAEGAGEDGFKFDLVNGAAYYNGSAVVSGFSLDQTVARLLQKCDRASRQNGKNISVLTGVTYGV